MGDIGTREETARVETTRVETTREHWRWPELHGEAVQGSELHGEAFDLFAKVDTIHQCLALAR